MRAYDEKKPQYPATVKLSDVKNIMEEEARLLSIDAVYIWSDEHNAYWRHGGSGYTCRIGGAGIFSSEDALKKTKHCGDEKQIEFEEVLIRTLPTAEQEDK